MFLAAGLGLEPRLTGPEPVVLPLDDPAAKNTKIDNFQIHPERRVIEQ